MLKTTSFFGLFILLCASLCAQSARNLVASAGNTDSTSALSISWSLGDIATTATYTEECTLILAEGFQQIVLPGDYACPFNFVEITGPANSPSFKIYPNPVTAQLNIAFDPAWTIPVQATVRDAVGRTLLSTSLLNNPAILDFQPMPASWYYLTLTDDSGWQYTLKVIKE
ncbi:MAG: T9SS type A sorting domain-containing protein [Saprospiraceae bacterium]|nr:T9SS type A sorting domain-containing protein [Saprospiraceae bacterium]